MLAHSLTLSHSCACLTLIRHLLKASCLLSLPVLVSSFNPSSPHMSVFKHHHVHVSLLQKNVSSFPVAQHAKCKLLSLALMTFLPFFMHLLQPLRPCLTSLNALLQPECSIHPWMTTVHPHCPHLALLYALTTLHTEPVPYGDLCNCVKYFLAKKVA